MINKFDILVTVKPKQQGSIMYQQGQSSEDLGVEPSLEGLRPKSKSHHNINSEKKKQIISKIVINYSATKSYLVEQ